jgi:integrase
MTGPAGKRGRGRPTAKPPRRASQQGTLVWVPGRQRWRVRITVGDPHDKWFADESDARAYLDEWNERVDPKRAPTLAELVEQYIEKRSPSWGVARSDVLPRQLRSTITHRAIGRLRADAVTPADVEDWLQELSDSGLREDSVKTYRRNIAGVTRWAVKRGLIKLDPVALAESPRGMSPRLPRNWLSLDQANRLVRHCMDGGEPWGPLFVTCALLGLRPGEACGITRDALDFEAGTLTIKTGLKRTAGCADSLGDTKTSRTRTLKPPPEVMAALRRQLDVIDVAQIVHGDEWSPDWQPLIFVNAASNRNALAGVPPTDVTLRTHLTRICERAGIPRIVPYGLRHSCASILLDRKVAPHVVAKLLGTSERMLHHHYEHLLDPILSEGLDVWAEVLKTDG